MCTGWTWEYIDDFMTIPRIKDMSAYWQDNPPLHQMVASYFGIDRKPKTEPTLADFEGLVGSGFSSEKPEWLKTE